VIQIESAMGAAIEVFEGATAIVVPRSRFLPVKTTNELVLLRSDVYEWGDDDIPRATVDTLPVVNLSSSYKKIGDLEAHMPSPLKLRDGSSLTVTGDWTFGTDVKVVGDVTLGAEGGHVPDSATLT
jgi:UTP--glucose-1-phosphate uridylyltransferase